MIRLEYIEREDFYRIIEWNEGKSADFLMQWAGPTFKYPLTIEQLNDFYTDNTNVENGNIYFYKIIDMEDNKMIGVVTFGNIDMENGSARIGRFLIGEEKFRGRGMGKEVLKQLLDFGFVKLHLHKITLGVFDFNINAISCYEGVGFRKDGLLRDYRKIGDRYLNLYEMSILENEWTEQKK